MKVKFLLFMIALFTSTTYAQNIEFDKAYFKANPKSKKVKKLLERGDDFYFNEDRGYIQALDYYLEAYSTNPKSALLNYKIANCYLHALEKTAALPYALKAYKLNPKVAYDIHYVMGGAYHQQKSFDSALVHYTIFRDTYSRLDADTVKLIAKAMDESVTAIAMYKMPTKYVVTNLGNVVNGPYGEYVPLVTVNEDMLIFTTRRPLPVSEKGKISRFDYEYFENIYRSDGRAGGWTEPMRMPAPINAMGEHVACISLSPDGKTIYTYEEENKGDIFYSSMEGSFWNKSRPLSGGINTEYTEAHITVTGDGKTAYLVSDRPGTLGGKDIWKVEKINEEEWGQPVNLGPQVNTPYDEDSPFIHPNEYTLYFSSKGHHTIGGFDVFETSFRDGSWSEPINLGDPVNGPDDDVFFMLTPDGGNAYFSSIKSEGYGLQDIYAIRPFEKKVIKQTETVSLRVIVVDKQTEQKIDSRVKITDLSTERTLLTADVPAAENGIVTELPILKKYTILAESDGYVFSSEEYFLEVKEGEKEVVKVVPMEKVRTGITFSLSNVFFEFDKSVLTGESVSELNKALDIFKQYPDMKIEMGGHCDSFGSDDYNLKLSQRRIDAVRTYLVKNGLDASRIKSCIGYGESQPIDTNETTEGRAKNRRVQFKLLP